LILLASFCCGSINIYSIAAIPFLSAHRRTSMDWWIHCNKKMYQKDLE